MEFRWELPIVLGSQEKSETSIEPFGLGGDKIGLLSPS